MCVTVVTIVCSGEMVCCVLRRYILWSALGGFVLCYDGNFFVKGEICFCTLRWKLLCLFLGFLLCYGGKSCGLL
jgi:hypothetical protein